MRIENHKLVGETDDFAPEWRPDEWGGDLDLPLIAVIHYSVTLSAEDTARVLKARDYVSAHLSIDRSGRIIQQVPLNKVAWHAGKSEYCGRPGVNKFGIGIEIANPGPLVRRDGVFYPTWPGAAPWDGEVFTGYHENDTGKRGWRYWAHYGDRELDLAAHLCELLRQEYGIVNIVGHDDVSPGRKSDPGPAFPLDWLRKAVFPNGPQG